ncbi:MAG: hypothetical protein NC388_10030 [Clostridium sp.]|nr:hypothetical protein [Clostridium sp.]
MENQNQLEEMRLQMAALSRKIEREEILNDKLLRRSMRADMFFLKQKHLLILAIGVLMIPYSVMLFGHLGLSVVFRVVTVVFFLIIIGYTMYVNRHLRYGELMNGNLLDVRGKVARAMKLEHDWLRFGLPAAILWVVWYAWEYTAVVDEESAPYIVGGIALAGLIGMTFGLRLRRRMLNAYRAILSQMDEVKEWKEEPADGNR